MGCWKYFGEMADYWLNIKIEHALLLRGTSVMKTIHR